jgi:3-dehydroquinate synthase
MSQLSCHLQLPPTSYDIVIRCGLLQEEAFLRKQLLALASRFVLIADEKTASLYGKALQKILGEKTLLLSFPGGEVNKTRATKEHLEDRLLEQGWGSDTCILALGGGVVTDLAGFVAATYCRGVPFVTIPTSLMAMIDASLGGKTGVNTSYGKNMIGCVYQPKLVLIDPCLVSSLPLRELRNGIVEIIKHGLIADASLFSYLDTHVDTLLSLDPETLSYVISESCRIKITLVEQGPKRTLLNFGHTVGHALEKLTDYTLPHGEAVAIGILVESHMALQMGLLQQKVFEKMQNLLARYGLPLKLPKRFSYAACTEAMQLDKKSLLGKPRFVLLEEMGSAKSCDGAYCASVEESVLETALTWMNDALCCN